MYHIHPNARTTPAVRAEIARSTESSGELAKRYGVSTASASGASAALRIAGTTPRVPRTCGGGPPTKSAPLSAICAA